MNEQTLTKTTDLLNATVALDWCKRNGYLSGEEWYRKFINNLPPKNINLVHLDGSNPEDFTIEWQKVNQAAKDSSGML